MTDSDDQLVWAFPRPDTPALIQAYNTLVHAAAADDDLRKAIDDPAKLPRPWDPPTCLDKQLRTELWQWLDRFVAWLNHEYVWDHPSGGMIPPCWPHHPHLVHDIAVLADQRRRAGLDLTSSSLEEWHRYCLPSFLERLRSRTKTLCDERHALWPAQGRYQRYTSNQAVADRRRTYAADTAELTTAPPPRTPPPTPRLRLVDDDGDLIDPDTGEVL